VIRLAATALAAAVALTFAVPASAASKIEPIVSPGGIKAWLVREPSVPMIAMDFAFGGGANADPADKPGVGNMVSSLLDEGAGDLDARTVQERLEARAIQIHFSSGRDHFRGSFTTLSANLDEATELLRLALTAPRFEPEPIERIRGQVLAQLRRGTTSPNDISNKQWWGTAFPGHPYGRPNSGTLESVPQINADDLKGYVSHVFAREPLTIGIVGDIDAERAGLLIDKVFGGLPGKATLAAVPDMAIRALGTRLVVDMDVPQTVIQWGGPGLARKDPDFFTAYVLNHILGAGSHTSRLYREVREVRGLAYGIRTSLLWFEHAAVLSGATATRSDRAREALTLIEEQIKRLAEEGPTQDELDKAKAYLKGAYAIAFDTSNKIAGQLVQNQLDDLGIDYPERRGAMIDAVTLAEAKRVARRLLDHGLLVSVVGRAQGFNKTN
jgi:zinc protease